MRRICNFIFKNLANIVSILGVLPLCILLRPQGYYYLPAMIVYNNMMDDLDGILARKLGIKSSTGALLDNICDATAHILIVMAVSGNHNTFIFILTAVPCSAILIRMVNRMKAETTFREGTPTNELMRHLLFSLVLETYFFIDLSWWIAILYLFHSITMLVPFSLSHQIRCRAKKDISIFLVNILLAAAVIVPMTAIFIGMAFVITYFFSFFVSGWRWFKGISAKPSVFHLNNTFERSSLNAKKKINI